MTGGLTLKQQVARLAGADTWHTAGFTDPPVAPIRMSDGPAGVRGTSWSGARSASFPCATALGATWDLRLIEQVGRALGREARSKSADVVLAPSVNLHRTPISGRNFEFPSEDPVLAAAFAVAYVRGVQHEGVAACIKHFVANETEFERMTISSEVDERTLRELYFVPFEAAVRDAGVRAVMSAYNKLNGTYCADHRWLLTEVLRDEWGFDGVVISDWFGCHSTVEAVRAGLDLEMPGPPRQRGAALQAALDGGEIDARELAPAVQRLLALGAWCRAGEHGTDEVTADDDETRDVIRRAAARGMVLLKNDDATLPITPTVTATETRPRLALIGPYARFGRLQGGGSARVTPDHGVGPLDGLRARGLDVTFEPGGSIAKYLPAMRGEFSVEFADPDGGTATVPTSRLAWYWDEAPAPGVAPSVFSAHITGTFTPEQGGDWELGVRVVGTVSVRLDDEVVLELAEPQGGGAFFGLGSQEVRTTVELEAGRSYTLDVDYPQVEGAIVRGLVIGAQKAPAGDHIERAVAVAAAADVAIVVVGTDDDWEAEGEDRSALDLPGDQDELVAAVAAANTHTIVVLNTGSPVTMPWLADVPAVVQMWFPGQAIGEALADVLFGDVEPGGRLPITFPARLEDTPAFANSPGSDGKAVYAEGLHIGYRWYDREEIEPLFPFGFGLGYTTFSIEPVTLQGTATAGAAVTVEVTNTGDRAGSEVVQVYVAPPAGDAARPVRHLAAFHRLDLTPGTSERVTIELDGRTFSSWLDGAWTVPEGAYRVFVGRSSRDVQPVGDVHA
ncbi:MAG: glycoside hydrolase family 3 C-terminal domain-containing protein [Actinomycetota bacterium]|nr:glycoside hydrolase family 3 C-terminal domain-containing protein [Actinomycetota bacterium]